MKKLIFKINKELIHLNNKQTIQFLKWVENLNNKQTIQFLKWVENLNRYFSRGKPTYGQ